MDTRLEDFRKNSSFFPNLAGPDANLTLPPTSPHLRILSGVDGYQCKEWVTSGFSRVESLRPLERFVTQLHNILFFCAYSFVYNYSANTVIA